MVGTDHAYVPRVKGLETCAWHAQAVTSIHQCKAAAEPFVRLVASSEQIAGKMRNPTVNDCHAAAHIRKGLLLLLLLLLPLLLSSVLCLNGTVEGELVHGFLNRLIR